jgi:hypothetical protein
MRSIRTAVCASMLALALAPAAALAGDDPVGGTLDQVQQATNGNSTSQDAQSTATTKQVNVNAPVSVLSEGSNNGDVKQSNDATTVASSENDNETHQSNEQEQQGSVQGGGSSCGCDRPNGDSGATQDQSAENKNDTSQNASSDATTKQANVNVPISVLSKGSNNGDVRQSNDATTIAKSENENTTKQSNDQDQHGWVDGARKGGGSLSQSQDASNDNSTSQNASSDATTKQANVNVPISVLSKGSNNGDVRQSNDATTIAKSENENTTKQSNDQDQHGSVRGGDDRGEHGGHGDEGHRDDGCHKEHCEQHKPRPCDEHKSHPCDEHTSRPCDEHKPRPCKQRRRDDCRPQKDRCEQSCVPCLPCQGGPLGGLIG